MQVLQCSFLTKGSVWEAKSARHRQVPYLTAWRVHTSSVHSFCTEKSSLFTILSCQYGTVTTAFSQSCISLQGIRAWTHPHSVQQYVSNDEKNFCGHTSTCHGSISPVVTWVSHYPIVGTLPQSFLIASAIQVIDVNRQVTFIIPVWPHWNRCTYENEVHVLQHHNQHSPQQ